LVRIAQVAMKRQGVGVVAMGATCPFIAVSANDNVETSALKTEIKASGTRP
jgi:hypothetical protein